jgi:hypothetical protein
MLSKSLGSKGEEETGDCRKLQNEELHDLYSSSNIIRVIKLMNMEWGRMWEKENAYRALVRKCESKTPLWKA